MQKSCFSYPVEFTADMFGESEVLAKTLRTVTGSEHPKTLIVADQNIVQHTEGLGAKIGRYVQEHGIQIAGNPVVMTGGERVKTDNLQSALKVVSAILSAKLGRNDAVLALGGGSVLDVAGYAAAQVRGGVKIVRLPTTPAAMVDGAFATYAAVDSASVKDALRVPSVPAAVLIDTAFASTVLDGVWRSGFAEAMRFAVVSDAALVKKLVKLREAYCTRDAAALDELVRAVVASKTKKGLTDFGLWAPFRLQAMSGYKLPQGYAVAMGVAVDLCYAAATGLLDADDRDTVLSALAQGGMLDGIRHSASFFAQTEELMRGLDAWALSTGQAALTMPIALGKSKTVEMPDREAYAKVFKEILSLPPRT